MTALDPAAPAGAPQVALILDGAGWAGTERHVRGLVRHLHAGGWNVHLIASEDGPLLREASAFACSVHVVRRSGPVPYVISLAVLLRRLQLDLAHAHSGRLACLAARLAGVPAVLETRHGLIERLRPFYQRYPAARRWEGWKCALSDLTLTVCQADADWLRTGGLSPRRIRVVPNGVDAPERPAVDSSFPLESDARALGPTRTESDERRRLRGQWEVPEGATILGYIGRLAPEKAPERVLDLLALLLTDPAAMATPATGGARAPARNGERMETWAVICGGGALEPRLKTAAERLGLAERIRWLPPRAAAERIMPGLDLLLVPSLTEGMPYVVLEALRAGLPVLATPVGGIAEVLQDPVLGRGCLDWAAVEWARRARELADPARRESWAEAAHRRLREFPESRTVAEVEQIYRELLARRFGPAQADGCMRTAPGSGGGAR